MQQVGYFPFADHTPSPEFLCWKAHENVKVSTGTGYFNR